MRLPLSPKIMQPAYFRKEAPLQTSIVSPQQSVSLFAWGARDWLFAATNVQGEKEHVLKGRPGETDVEELEGLKRSSAYLQTQ